MIHKQTLFLCLPLVLLLGFSSCTREDCVQEERSFEDFMIPESQVWLYADMTSYDLAGGQPSTRSGECMVTLKSLLDFTSETYYESGGVKYRQVPFISNTDGCMVVMHNKRDSIDMNDAMPIRKYYIQAINEETSQEYIATMIPKGDSYKEADFDFLHKAAFSGLVLFSKLDGQLYYAKHYVNGRIERAYLANSKDISNVQRDDLAFFSVLVPQETRGLLDWLVAIVGGFYGGDINPAICFGSYVSNGNGAGGTGPGGNGGRTGFSDRYNNLIQETYYDGPVDWEDPPLEPSFIVWVQSNVPQHVAILGSDLYTEGQWCQIDAAYISEQGEDYSFVDWVGDLEGRGAPPLVFRVNNDIISIALYSSQNDKLPCRDINRGLINPLRNMQIAKTSKETTDYRKGIYGKNYRWEIDKETGLKKPKRHDGIDLQAPVGTPVYAICNGIITMARGNCPDGKQKKGSGWTYGNEIRIRGTVINAYTGEEQEMIFQYAHLQYANAIAMNFKTGHMFKEGDWVYAGELIGYTGESGNAYHVDYPHLHFGAQIVGEYKWIDPLPYLNATYDLNTINSKYGKMDIRVCDDEDPDFPMDIEVDEDDACDEE